MITIGEKLKEARIQKELTIDDLQQRTKIQKRYLEALEDNDFEAMPGTYYVRAFIRQYADAVGLDGSRMVKAYDGKSIILRSGDEEQIINSSRKDFRHDGKKITEVRSKLPFILLAFVALSIVAIVIAMTWKDQQENPIISKPEEVEVTGTTSSSTAETESASVSSSDTTTSSSEESDKNEITFVNEAGSEVNMTIKQAEQPLTLSFEGLNGPCWIGVMVGGTYVYEYTLQPGELQQTTLATGTSEATLVLGNSKNVAIKANNKKLEFDPNQTMNIKKNIHLLIN